MTVHYLEIVSNDVDTLTGLYEHMHGLSFGPPDPDLGQARVATRAEAEDSGATIAYPPTRQGQRGTFAIVIQGDVQHGLWQR